jgi:protease I
MKHALFIIAPEGFRDEELFEPKQILEDNNFMCDIVSTIDGVCLGKLGAQATTTVSLHTLDVTDYDVLVIVGGPRAPALIDSFLIVDVIKEAYKKNKVLAAICVAPTILAKLGLLANKKATVHTSSIDILKEQKVVYVEEPVVVDGSDVDHIFITANGPDAAIAFGEKIIEILKH